MYLLLVYSRIYIIHTCIMPGTAVRGRLGVGQLSQGVVVAGCWGELHCEANAEVTKAGLADRQLADGRLTH